MFDVIKGLPQQGGGANVDVDQVTANVVGIIEGKSVKDKFHLPKEKGGFKDLVDNEKAFKLVNDEINTMLDDGKPNSWETYQTAGNEIRKFLGWEKPKTTPENEKEIEPDKELEAKTEKKRELDNIQPTGAVVETSVTDDKSKTHSETIEEMRTSRPGQII